MGNENIYNFVLTISTYFDGFITKKFCDPTLGRTQLVIIFYFTN